MNKQTLIQTVTKLNYQTHKSYGTAIDTSLEALELAKEYNNPALIAQSQAALGDFYVASGNTGLAIHHLTIAENAFMQLPKDLKDPWWLGQLYCCLGVAQNELGNYFRALWYHKLSLIIDTESGRAYGQQRGLVNIGFIHLNMGNGEEAINFLQQAIQHPTQSPRLTSTALGHLGAIYKHKKHYILAKSNYLQACEVSQAAKIKQSIFLAQAASCAIHLGELAEAQKLLMLIESDEHGKQHVFEDDFAIFSVNCELLIAKLAYELAWDACVEIAALAQGFEQLQRQWIVIVYKGIILFKQGEYDVSIALLKTLDYRPLAFILRHQVQSLFIKLYSATENWQQMTQVLQGLHQYTFIRQSRLLTLYQLNEEQHYSKIIEENNRLLALKNLELKTLYQEKDNLSRIVAHDLKTPVAAALLMLKGVQRLDDAMPEEEQAANLKDIATVIRQMNNIVSQLTSSTELEKHSHVIFEDIRLDQVIERIVAQHAPLIKDKQQQLILHPLTLAVVHGREIWFEQVFSNLLSNAIKYTQPEGTITVSFSLNQIEQLVQVSVEDDGQGLSAEDLKNLYVKYQKLSAVPTKGESSTGLGLYIVNRLVNLMEGTISAESLGKYKGSTFSVTFPLIMENSLMDQV